MADTDREYRKAFYRALNVHQGAGKIRISQILFQILHQNLLVYKIG